MSIGNYFKPEDINSYEDMLNEFSKWEKLGEIININLSLFSPKDNRCMVSMYPVREKETKDEKIAWITTGDNSVCMFDEAGDANQCLSKLMRILVEDGKSFEYRYATKHLMMTNK